MKLPALVSEGFRVRAWGNADAFMAEYDTAAFGCLVTDVAMPGTDGLQLQKKLAEHNQSLPVIFISGHGHVRMSVEAMRAGAVTFLHQVLDLVVVGRMNKQIAAQLGASEKTIKVHRGRVMGKMNVHSVAELVHITGLVRASAPET